MRHKFLIILFSLLTVLGINKYILFFRNIDSNRISIGECPVVPTQVSSPSRHSKIAMSEAISKLRIAESIFSAWLPMGTRCFAVIELDSQHAVLLQKREVATKYWVETSIRDVRMHKISVLILETTNPSDGDVLGWKMIEYSDSGELRQKTPSLIDYTLYKIQKTLEFPPVGIDS